MLRRTVAFVAVTLSLSVCTPAMGRQEKPDAIGHLQTVAESSGYKATSTYAEVVAMVDAMAKGSPLARRVDIGSTVENRDIPMLVLADPAVSSPEQAAAQEKIVVLITGNIHAGEVAGKEALLMLARNVLAGDDRELLDHLILCIVPIYNADGNERFGLDNRPGQVGPEKGMGQRPNAQGLDLNRDFMKMDAPETRALIKVMRKWNPQVYIDTHTTNGSLHRYLITYTGPKSPAGDRGLIDYAHDTMMPRITAGLKERTGYDSFFYGNFNRDHTQWESYPAEGRYGTTYFGLRNGLSILSEAYAYASYKDRVLGSLEFVRECLRDISANRGEVEAVIKQADDRAKRNPGSPIALRSKFKARPEKVTALGFVEQQVGDTREATKEPSNYLVELVDDFEPTLEVAMPAAYLMAPSQREIALKLQWHGVQVLELREDIELDVEIDRITSLKRAERAFQNRKMVTLEVDRRRGQMGMPAGTLLVRTDQPLGRLAAYLLESQSDDGFATWDFWGSQLKQGEDYPIVRLPKDDQHLWTTPYRPLDDERTFGQVVTEETLRDRRGMPNFSGNALRVMRWLDDEHYLVNKGGLRKVEATTGRSEPYTQEEREFDTAPIAAALAALPTIDQRSARNYANRAPSSLDPTGAGAFFLHENDLYYVTADGSVARRLTSTPEREELAEFSPNGKFVAFVRDNDLFVVDVETATERALTTGGSDILRKGKADWVYFEELFGRNWKAYWWSPDSSRIAFLETDSSMVPEFTITNNSQYQQRVEVARYPKPGQPNPQVRLGTVTAGGGEPQWVDLSNYEAADMLISEVGWWPDSGTVYFYAQNRIQTWLDFCKAPADGGEPTRLFRDQTEAWIESPGAPRFLDDAGFLLSSDRTGYRHWYRYDADGNLLGPITSGEGEVRGIERLDLEHNLVFASGTRDNGIGSDLYRFESGGDGVRLTNGQGSHNVSISPSGKYFIDSWSSFDQTPRVELRDATTGKLLRTIDSNPVYALEEWKLGREEHAVIAARDGFPLDATVLYPANFDARKQYPVWLTTYAGPHAPTVSDRWSGGRVRDQVLAGEGIVLLETHPRSASNRGSVTTWTAYKQLGVQELRDIEDVVRWLTAKPYIDGARVGMSGHSYGGFMTAFALTHSDLFCAGIAGAPPTDWREYDSIYTERYMSTPQENPEGYDATSVILAAKNLHGRLRILHGTMDDNVHMQNSIRLVKALQDADKDFEMMFYPGFRHGIFNRHYQRTTNEFILESLGVGKEPKTSGGRIRSTTRSDADGWYDAGD